MVVNIGSEALSGSHDVRPAWSGHKTWDVSDSHERDDVQPAWSVHKTKDVA